MSADWYYQQPGGQAVGPITSKDLITKIRQGEVLPNTLVRKGDSQWVEAFEINGLEIAVTKDRAFHCPYCDAEIRRPPCICLGCATWVEFTERFSDPERPEEEEVKKQLTPKVVRQVSRWVRSLMNDDEPAS